MPDNNKNVAKMNISNSFRGILRISPDETQGDIGLKADGSLMPVYDSLGVESALSIGTEKIRANKGEYNNSTFIGTLDTIDSSGNKTNFSIEQINHEEILLGDENHNFIHYNLRQFLDEYFATNTILEQLVPVGTIIYTVLNGPLTADTLNKLPEKYRDWYDFCIGQDTNTISSKKYNKITYPDLARVLGITDTNDFNLPDLRNAFIRSASDIEKSFENSEGTYSISEHSALTVEDQLTNVSNSVNIASATFPLYVPYQSGTPLAQYDNQFKNSTYKIINKWTGVTYMIYGDGGQHQFQVYKYTIGDIEGAKEYETETRPYNVTLIPLIKVK